MNQRPIKPKKCKQCGKEFKPFNSLQKVCNYVCATAFARAKTIDDRFLGLKKKVKDRDSYKLLMKTAKLLVQKYARLRDAKLPCISCGSDYSVEFHGGHLWKAEIWRGIVLEEINVNKQCKKCNVYLDGNELMYVEGFLKKYGQDKFNELYLKAKATKDYKWERAELAEKINYYKEKINQLNAEPT